MHRSADLYDALADGFPEQAAYAVAMAYRVRYVMQFNAREAMHLLELRSSTQGHPAYRRIALEMHRLIAEQAGHRAVAEAMTHLTTAEPPSSNASTPSGGRRRAGPDRRWHDADRCCDRCHRGASGRRGSPPLSSAAWLRRMTTM